MAQKCSVCGSRDIRETLSGVYCEDCKDYTSSVSATAVAEIEESNDNIGGKDNTTSAGGFRVPTSRVSRAQDLHEDRPEFNQERDEERRARVTTDFDKWASDMDSFDFPSIDTPTANPDPMEKDKPFVDEDSVLDDLF